MLHLYVYQAKEINGQMYHEGDENAVHVFARHMRIQTDVTVFSAINISGRFSPSKRTEREGCHVSGSEERDTLHSSDSLM